MQGYLDPHHPLLSHSPPSTPWIPTLFHSPHFLYHINMEVTLLLPALYLSICIESKNTVYEYRLQLSKLGGREVKTPAL